MKGTFQIELPDKIDATLTVTMTLAEWKQLRAQVAGNWPGWKFSEMITDLIRHAEKQFYQRADPDGEAG